METLLFDTVEKPAHGTDLVLSFCVPVDIQKLSGDVGEVAVHSAEPSVRDKYSFHKMFLREIVHSWRVKLDSISLLNMVIFFSEAFYKNILTRNVCVIEMRHFIFRVSTETAIVPRAVHN